MTVLSVARKWPNTGGPIAIVSFPMSDGVGTR